MSRLTDKVTEHGTGKVLAYTLKQGVKPLTAVQRLGELEDMKLREHSYDNCHNYTCRKKCEKDGYKKAIDEFAEKLRRNFSDIGAFTGYGVKREIDKVAEQLKGE